MVLTDASQNIWEKRWFVLKRPYLYIYSHSNELEEVGVVSLEGVNVESDPHKELLLGKPFSFTLFTSSNSHALAAPSLKELQSWSTKLDPTRLPS
jgi:kinesin family protein 1